MSITSLIDQLIHSNPALKAPPDYLAMKSGFLPLKVGFHRNPEPNQNEPTI